MNSVTMSGLLAADEEKIRNELKADEAGVVTIVREIKDNRIVKETDSNEKLQRSVRLEAANAKKTFDQLKADYEEESRSKKGELETQRAKAKELMDQVDPALLEEYETIKKHITPPVARLTHGQCAGCNTSLPSAILSKIKGGTLVECETCGRMIIP